MNIYFSGIGGVGLGPLAEIALDAEHTVTGSDQSESLMTQHLTERDIVFSTDQTGKFLQQQHEKQPIDWLVYTAALPEDHPELLAARELGIKTSKRDQLLLHILEEKNLKLIAVAGTHGKTTTTGMIVWLARYFGIPLSYCVGTTLSWGPSGKYTPNSEYFVYECDEFDRNFLQFHPFVSIVTTVEHDHPDTYPTEADYMAAFSQFGEQSETLVTWREYETIFAQNENSVFVDAVNPMLRLKGEHNRRNASLILAALEKFGLAAKFAADGLNKFPGTSRRFERLADNLYTDYGHTPSEIAATLQMARELSDNVVLIYEPHQNVRQHEIRDQYTDDVFKDASEVYWLPTYQSREDKNLEILAPEQLISNLETTNVHSANMDNELWNTIQKARDEGKLVLCMGAGSIDDWVRQQVNTQRTANVLLVHKDGKHLIMQQRDDKPDICNPGMISAFGGSVEDGEETRHAALRELREETNLKFTDAGIEYLKTIYQPLGNKTPKWITYYILRNVDIEGLEVYEGQGYKLIDPANSESDNLTPPAREIVAYYAQSASE